MSDIALPLFDKLNDSKLYFHISHAELLKWHLQWKKNPEIFPCLWKTCKYIAFMAVYFVKSCKVSYAQVFSANVNISLCLNEHYVLTTIY